jgi:hypothetical protein
VNRVTTKLSRSELPNSRCIRTRCISVFSLSMLDKSTGKDGKPRDSTSENSLVGKAAWISAELLGNAASAFKGGDSKIPLDQSSQSDAVLSRDEALARLKREYERSYFISGEMDIDLYTEDCLFAGNALF